MKLLAIESSCDETAAAVVENGRRVLSSVINSQVEEHRQYGGVVPEIASRRHTENIIAVTQKALDDASVCLEGIDGIAVTYAPGLIGAVLVGVNFAKGLAMATKKPLIPVHHIRGHIAANYLAHPELEPPFLCLVVSGGHSHLIEVLDYTKFHIVGRTRDDAAGEAFDKAAPRHGIFLSRRRVFGSSGPAGRPVGLQAAPPESGGQPLRFQLFRIKDSGGESFTQRLAKGRNGGGKPFGCVFPAGGGGDFVQPLSGGGRAVRIPKAGHRRRGVGQFRAAGKNGGCMQKAGLHLVSAASVPMWGQRCHDRFPRIL